MLNCCLCTVSSPFGDLLLYSLQSVRSNSQLDSWVLWGKVLLSPAAYSMLRKRSKFKRNLTRRMKMGSRWTTEHLHVSYHMVLCFWSFLGRETSSTESGATTSLQLILWLWHHPISKKTAMAYSKFNITVQILFPRTFCGGSCSP